MKQVILSADGDQYLYSVPDPVAENLDRSLMTVTALTPIVGYENGAKIAKLALRENISLKEAALRLGLFTPEEFDRAFHPEEMI